ncbi:MAG: ABC transporter substrate-binding protein [Acidimicrobiales bacterium]
MRRLLIPMILLLALLAAACGSDSDSSDEAGTADTTPAESSTTAASEDDGSAGGDTTDDEMADGDTDGGEDTDAGGAFGGAPAAIVSLNPSATEMLFAIGAGPQVKAVDNFSYYPPEAPVVDDLSAFDPNIEAIAALEPDLVVLSDATIVEQLDGLGINSLVLPAAVVIDDTYVQIEQLGAVTGRVGDAAELVGQMQTDIAAAVDGVEVADPAPTYFHELDNTLFSVTSGTFIGEVYGLFGLENVADAAGGESTYPQLTEEFLLGADPDYIFLADTLCCEQTAETVAARPGWDALAAVENGTVVELDDDVASRWGPRLVDFVEDIAAALALVPAEA